jgi:hypothetical protein
MTKPLVERSFYDILSLFLIFVFGLYILLSKNKTIVQVERKIEKVFYRFGNKWIRLLDVLVVLFALFYAFKISRLLYTYPISCSGADMLPIIRGAGEYLLSFENPFDKFYCPWNGRYPYPPMMMVYFLPGVLLKFDIRFLSYIFFITLLFSIYWYHRKNGRYLTGFLIFICVLSSNLSHYYFMNLHTFPYLLVLGVILIALYTRKNKLFFFTFALALATRRVFWFFLPFFVILAIKERKLSFSNVKYSILGAISGCIPFLLYPKTYTVNLIAHLQSKSGGLKNHLFLKHSLGLTYHFFNSQDIAKILTVFLLVILFLLAIVYLKRENLWLFLSLMVLFFLYFMTYTRPQEYYFLPLIVILAVVPLDPIGQKFDKIKFGLPALLTNSVILFVFLFYPLLVGKGIIINPLRGNVSAPQERFLSSKGYLEVSIAGGFKFGEDKNITLFLRRRDYVENQPADVKIDINDTNIFKKSFYRRNIKIVLDEQLLKKHLYTGSNLLAIAVEDPEFFTLRISVD